MAQKFLSLEEAAQLLSLSKEKLNDLREAGQIYAYRDGAGWKFKQEEVDRVAAELREGGGSFDDAEIDLELAGDENDSILLSEVELGDSPNTSSSTIIGKQDGAKSDVRAADESALTDSDLKLAGGSGLELDADLDLGATGSDVLAAGKTPKGADPGDTAGSGISSHFDDIEELEFDLESASHIDQPSSPSAAGVGDALADLDSLDLGDDALQIGDEDELGLSLGGSDLSLDPPPAEVPTGPTSDVSLDPSTSGLALGGSDLTLGAESTLTPLAGSDKNSALSDVMLAPGESSVKLADDEDDEMVIGGGSGSDITLGSGDSGISLVSPSDSGISLDEAPLQLGGSAVESLDLGGDDEILLEAEADSEAATMLKTDEDFMLTPLDEGAADGDDDSSQVIALDSESFDESADTLLGGVAFEAAPGGADDLGFGAAAPAAGGFAAGGAALASAPVSSEPEAPYTIWNVLSLTLCFLLLTMTGIMLFDLIRNMWSWDQPYALNSSLMDGLIKAIPIFKQQ